MNYSRGEITKIILKTLLAGAIIAGVVVLAPGIGPVLKMFMPKYGKDKNKFLRSLKKLEGQKLVSIKYKGDEAIITITEKGKIRVLRYNFEELAIKKPKKWDGYWRIIVFDIPNTKKRQRDLFRMKLKEVGFRMIQKSTFIIPYPAKNEVDFVGEFLGIRKHVTYILARKIEGGKNLRAIFKV